MYGHFWPTICSSMWFNLWIGCHLPAFSPFHPLLPGDGLAFAHQVIDEGHHRWPDRSRARLFPSCSRSLPLPCLSASLWSVPSTWSPLLITLSPLRCFSSHPESLHTFGQKPSKEPSPVGAFPTVRWEVVNPPRPLGVPLPASPMSRALIHLIPAASVLVWSKLHILGGQGHDVFACFQS